MRHGRGLRRSGPDRRVAPRSARGACCCSSGDRITSLLFVATLFFLTVFAALLVTILLFLVALLFVMLAAFFPLAVLVFLIRHDPSPVVERVDGRGTDRASRVPPSGDVGVGGRICMCDANRPCTCSVVKRNKGKRMIACRPHYISYCIICIGRRSDTRSARASGDRPTAPASRHYGYGRCSTRLVVVENARVCARACACLCSSSCPRKGSDPRARRAGAHRARDTRRLT
ncbi:hypothetical protein BURMUCGD1_3983 [Burkholderia multivorans CGD1]|nr:hypothetical protein BURMUCGD1_3983 [Burkholderia multivorans CGD1]